MMTELTYTREKIEKTAIRIVGFGEAEFEVVGDDRTTT